MSRNSFAFFPRSAVVVVVTLKVQIKNSLILHRNILLLNYSIYLQSSKIPQADWLRMGLWQPRPKYTDRVYYSSKCMPTKGETRLFHSMMRRTRRSVREVIALVAQAKESFLRSDKNMEEYIRVSDRF